MKSFLSSLSTEEIERRLLAVGALESTITRLGSNLIMFCIEPVTVTVGDQVYDCPAGLLSSIPTGGGSFTITPTSNSSIYSILNYPAILSQWEDWLEGVMLFSNVVFDMNSQDMYTKWSQANQGMYHIQKAQYVNCVFWSDLPYINDLAIRTNYTLYNSFQLPLCYSTIPENTYKPFYLAYGVKSDPNWSNTLYLNSFSLTTTATAPFSYYGMSNIGIFNMAVDPILLPKDCRGLCFYSPGIERLGVLDAAKTTTFGAKSGSWREAFGYCSSLKTLYIQNLKTSLNLSWSPLEVDSLEFIISNTINTSAITISLSPFTWYRLTDSIRQMASERNITLALLTTNYVDDSRLSSLMSAMSVAGGVVDFTHGATVSSSLISDPLSVVNKQYVDEAIASAVSSALGVAE